MQNKELDALLFSVEAAHPNQEFDEASLGFWHASMAKNSMDEIKAAFAIHIDKSKFLPTIAEINEIIEKQRGPVFSIEDRAAQQWRIVIMAVVRQGVHHPPIFTDPITAHLIKTLFRWSRLCEMREDQEHWEQKRWIASYVQTANNPKDFLKIEASSELKALVSTITKPMDPNLRHKRIEELRKQAKKLEKESV
jgi:hypothetical protein